MFARTSVWRLEPELNNNQNKVENWLSHSQTQNSVNSDWSTDPLTSEFTAFPVLVLCLNANSQFWVPLSKVARGGYFPQFHLEGKDGVKRWILLAYLSCGHNMNNNVAPYVCCKWAAQLLVVANIFLHNMTTSPVLYIKLLCCSQVAKLSINNNFIRHCQCSCFINKLLVRRFLSG